MPNDNVLTARVADLLHLLEFATIHTPTEGDGPQIIDAIRDIKAFLAAHPGQPEPRAEVTVDQILNKAQAWHFVNRPGVEMYNFSASGLVTFVRALFDAARTGASS